jgi:lipopolysaccharide transport system ATP-binding protein
MSEYAIRVANLGKKYHIGAVRDPRYRTLGESVMTSVAAPFRRAGKLLRGQATGAAELDEIIWALLDLTFDIRHGEVVGFIGHNGAGKSTLLKILSRITEPSTGYAEIRGRVGSLLEVGTGFHPELTGRENVYLNGAILGMTRADINRRFDEIVAFSEIEKFIDTPVKHYSSGMGLRLAFGVAAHLEPEVLIVDEVLAVGDASFQRKCLGKMGEVAGEGRTVIMVSHNMSAITQLCDRAYLLFQGEVIASGSPGDVVSTYLSAEHTLAGAWTVPADELAAAESQDAVIHSVKIIADDGETAPVVSFDRPYSIEIEYRIHKPVRDVSVVFGVTTPRSDVVLCSWDTDSTEWDGMTRAAGRYISRCHVPARALRPGRYLLNVTCHIPGVRMIDNRIRVVTFDVSTDGYPFHHPRPGAVAPLFDWDVVRTGE